MHEKFSESLGKHALKIINFKMKKMLVQKNNVNKQTAEIKWKNLLCLQRKVEDKCIKVRDHCHYTSEYRGAVDSIFNLKFSVPKEIPIVFHNGSNY